MPSIDRDPSRDREAQMKHQHSASSDCGRAIVPMWDSSDPDRAPPPLPMNPSSPSIAASRPNTSSAIQSAHAALTEKARENAYLTNTIAKRIETSPERSLVKGATHKRMQSLQTGNVRDLSNFLEGGPSFNVPRSPEKIANRPGTPQATKDFMLENRLPEKDRSTTPTPSRESPTRELNLRPSLRRPPQSILGENTPPQSATMLALQNMPSRDVDSPLSNVTNGSTALVRTPQTFDAISNQILSLTSIATNLQREMAQLSRRSKDNATDLVSLKEATNARDEDIRKSLRDLVVNLSEPGSRTTSNLYGGGGIYLDNKAHNSPGLRAVKPFQLPRIPSPNSFAASLDRESVASPMTYHHDGSASIALLEKILREMGTKEGQDLLVSRLTEVADRLARDGMSTAKKLEDLVQFIKTNTSQELVAHNGGEENSQPRNISFNEPPRLELDFDQSRSGPMTQRVEALLTPGANKENIRASTNSAKDILIEDILKIIRTVKDSVAQGGGLTAEVKALVRELRGEVLGMGREIGRKLDESSSKDTARDTDAEKGRVARVVQDGLEELKQHMDQILRENRRQSSSSSVSRASVDYQEIYNAVHEAVNEKHSSQRPGLEKEDIIEAVREAWETYKPDIELQHFGLEREELLACLKEGIQEYAPRESDQSNVGATKEEVFKAVVEGLKHFSPPRVETEASLSREEVCDAVRSCLEEFDFPSAPLPGPKENDITKDDMVGAVREGLSYFDFAANNTALSRDVSEGLTRADLFDAVKAGLQDAYIPMDAFGEKVLEHLQEIMESMNTDFKAVSDEAKQNVAAHGRDTEQVLDATKDGFEKLRADIESYVDRTADITGKDDILEIMKESFDALRAGVETLISKGSSASLKSVQSEFESLRETMATSVVLGGVSADKDEILEALRDGLDSVRADIERPRGSNESILSGTGEILDALHDGLTGLRAEVEKISNKPVQPMDMTVNYEILDTLKEGLEGVRADIDRIREEGHSDRAVAPIMEGAVITAESLKRNDIENLESLITQLRIKVEALEAMSPLPAEPAPVSISKEDLAGVEETLRRVDETVSGISNRGHSNSDDAATKEDVVAIETLLRNTKAKIDDLDPGQAVKKDHLDSVEAIVTETQASINDIVAHLDDVSKREDVNVIESLIREVVISLEDMKERAMKEPEDLEKVTKTDVEAVEAVCLDVKSAIEQMVLPDIAALASKDDVKNLEEMVQEFKGRIEAHADTNAKASEERQAETIGVGERVTEVKNFLEEFRDAIKEKLDEGSTSVEALGKILESLGETINLNATVVDDVKQLSDLLRVEFEKSNAGVVGSKLEVDEKFLQTWDKFDGKIDERFNELIAKYDDAQISAEAKTKLGEERNAEAEAALLGTKAIVEDLKLLIDGLSTNLIDSVEKMDQASKTVFDRVDDTFTRVEETHADAKAEHQLTRDQVFKTIGAIEGVQAHVTEYHPKILESIKDVLLIVEQHYDHSKSATTTIQEKIAGIPASAPVPDTSLLRDIPVPEKYDDAQVHEKLDKLVDHMHSAEKPFAQLDMLDKIHLQVMQTATEVSDFITAQTQRIANDHEDKEKAVEAATIALEKRIAQKEGVEASVVGLREEEDQLKHSVSILKAEQENLAQQKMRLCSDVSSLETALQIRREELHAMEARAEGLERRILEGVIDHSRALLISKANKGRDAMSRKRVPSHATSTTGSVVSSAASRASHTTQSAVTMAMGGNRAIVNVPISNAAGTSRRILSLNQITHNVPTGGINRSHSVKTHGGSGALRKSSWGGSLSRKYGDLNKENLALKESEEENESADGDMSEGETNRRSSRDTTILTGTGVSESNDEGTEWTGSEDDDHANDGPSSVVLYEEAGEVV